MYKDSEINKKEKVKKIKLNSKKSNSEFLDMSLYEDSRSGASFCVASTSSCAHNLHQNMETLALNNQGEVNNIVDEESFLHKINQKLQQSIVDTNNRDIEVKLDLLTVQNEILIRKCLYLENICERFFSKISNIESDMAYFYEKKSNMSNKLNLVSEKDLSLEKNTKILYDSTLNENIKINTNAENKKNLLSKIISLFKVRKLIEI